MPNEICLKHTATGATIKAAIIHPIDRSKGWDGAAFTAFSSISLATWRTALVSLTEQQLSTSELTGIYVGSKPSDVPLPCTVLFYQGATPSPGDVILGQQELTDLELVDVGNAVADAGNTASTFKTNLTGADSAEYVGRLLVFGGGATVIRQPRRITAYNPATKFVTLASALAGVPVATNAFAILGFIET